MKLKKWLIWLGLLPAFAISIYAIMSGQTHKWYLMGTGIALFILWFIWATIHINDINN